MSETLDIEIPNELSRIGELAEAVEGFCAAHGLSDRIGHHLTLVLDELVTNIITYGYAPEAAGGHRIHLHLGLAGDLVVARLIDDARPFNILTAPPPDLEAPLEERPIGGLGIHFVRSLMDDIAYERRDPHNILTLRKRLCAESE